MTALADHELLVPRSCTARNEQNGQNKSLPLANYRGESAYVLLGDPGAGKTRSFEQEAEATGGYYIRARSFAALEPSSDLTEKTLFIDGLDEMRAGGGDGRTPLDHIRHHLFRLKRPRFRLSCREADWYGDSDSAALIEAAPGGKITVLHLDALSDEDIKLLLERKFSIPAPEEFIRKAEHHGLTDLLRNPQTLSLLAAAVGTDDWPNSRTETFDLACRQLLRELNLEHRAATRNTAPTQDAQLDAAGFLCAVHLLAGVAGFALDDEAMDEQHPLWRELTPPHELPLAATLASGLFRRDEGEQQRIPAHRSIAEFLGARYLANLIDDKGLPLGRVIALLAGEDGRIVPDLRGLAAWLTVHCHRARLEFTKRDPLGVILYGDVHAYPADDKQRIFTALRDEAERYANFRFEDWNDAPFGALSTPDMVPLFLEILANPSRDKVDIALLECVLDALRHGPPLTYLSSEKLPHLEALLEAVVRDGGYPSHVRHTALNVLLHELPRSAERLLDLAKEINAGTIIDEDDDLLGRLLAELFPEYIQAEVVFDFLRPRKEERRIGGNYRIFWRYHLPRQASDALLPILLDQLSKRSPMRYESYNHYWAERMAGGLLARALEVHGDTIDDSLLLDWLGTGLDQYNHPRIESEHQERIRNWLSKRPERYKALLLVGVKHRLDKDNKPHCIYHSMQHLYGAEPPEDIVAWYLEQAATETDEKLRKDFFSHAVRDLIHQGGEEWLTSESLDYLALWIAEHPEFEKKLESFVSCDLMDWRRENAARDREWDIERRQQEDERYKYFRDHLDSIRDGSAPPGILHDLAQAYLDLYYDIEGENPKERMADYLNNDQALISAAYSGFRHSLDRNDLPSVAEIVDLETKGRMHYIRQPCLVGIEELYSNNPEAAMQLDDELLRKLIAFRYTWLANEEEAWFSALIKLRPELVAEVLVAYALPMLRKGKEHVNGIWSLANSDEYAMVARLALPELLKGFPLRAKNLQLHNALDPLLKAANRYFDHTVLPAIISARLSQKSMSASQRVYWLTCGLLTSPKEFEEKLVSHIGNSKILRGHLGTFLHDRRPGTTSELPESTLGLLIELLAPDSPPERPIARVYSVTPPMQTAEEVRGFIDTLGGKPSEAAKQQLERLLALPELTPWHDRLQHAIHTQRIARRKATFRHLDIYEVCHTLANHEPANVADLAALTAAHLRDLARKIRDGSTNDYRQYWTRNKKGEQVPRSENECRDTLLSDLMGQVGRLDIDAIKEVYYADEKRADIRVSSGGAMGFNVPIEIKKDSHSNLWRAIHEQLIALYTRDPGTGGFGIYLVFWFGGKGMPLPQEGKKPRSAAELEQRLSSLLSTEEARHIEVVVIDCALPSSGSQKPY